jgi:hypothetical protein
MIIRLRLNLIKKTPLVIAPSTSNLLLNYRLQSNILLITWIRALLSLVKPLLIYLSSLSKSLIEDFVFILTTINLMI